MNLSGYKEISINGISMKKITIGSVLVWERPGLLPSAYQQVQYIQTDGNQYIDTGVMASDYQDGLEYVFVGSCTGVHSSKLNNYLFGCLNSGKRSGNPVWNNGGKVLQIVVGGSAGAALGVAANMNADFTLRVKGTSKALDALVATYNDVTFTAYTDNFSNCDMPSANIYLLSANINGNYYSSSSAPFTGKLYSFTMADMNGTPIRNFVPCYRKADNVIGLYDTVGGVFYTNKGTGSFAKGVDV